MGVKQYIMADKKGMTAPTIEDYREEGMGNAVAEEKSEGSIESQEMYKNGQ